MWHGGSNFEQIDVVNHFYEVVDKGRVTLHNEHYISQTFDLKTTVFVRLRKR